MLPELLAQVPPEEPIDTLTADGAYDTQACHCAIAARRARAVIPTRRDGRLWKETTRKAQARNQTLRATRRWARSIWRTWSRHHRRSRVEAKRRCLKLPGERLMARDLDRQTAEIHIRVALLNRLTQLATPETTRVASRQQGSGEPRPPAEPRDKAGLRRTRARSGTI